MWIDALLLLIVVLCACLAMLIKDLLKAVIALGVGSAALAAVFFLLGCPWYQPFADFIKLLAKEDVLPEAAGERMCTALPLVAFAAVATAILYVPVGRAIYAFEGDLIVVAFLLWVPTLALSLAGWLSAGPFGLIEITEKRYQLLFHRGRCAFCAQCRESCSQGAIVLSSAFELASAEKEALSAPAAGRKS